MWPALAYVLRGLASARADTDENDVDEEIPDVDTDVPMDADLPGLGRKLPTPEQLLQMLDSMTGISEAEKASLRKDLLKNIEARASTEQAPMPSDDVTMQTVILLSLLGVVALIFVFFVYKLFKCLAEREMKREEKKKNKQMKKKK